MTIGVSVTDFCLRSSRTRRSDRSERAGSGCAYSICSSSSSTSSLRPRSTLQRAAIRSSPERTDKSAGSAIRCCASVRPCTCSSSCSVRCTCRDRACVRRKSLILKYNYVRCNSGSRTDLLNSEKETIHESQNLCHKILLVKSNETPT